MEKKQEIEKLLQEFTRSEEGWKRTSNLKARLMKRRNEKEKILAEVTIKLDFETAKKIQMLTNQNNLKIENLFKSVIVEFVDQWYENEMNKYIENLKKIKPENPNKLGIEFFNRKLNQKQNKEKKCKIKKKTKESLNDSNTSETGDSTQKMPNNLP